LCLTCFLWTLFLPLQVIALLELARGVAVAASVGLLLDCTVGECSLFHPLLYRLFQIRKNLGASVDPIKHDCAWLDEKKPP
jgi:hypothetical protein